ncbi:MAG: GNAT family N-acetyltransferase [Clostridia bacterium]|nr:GNAT family N-acetyltransferase [Clostridia bacterium]
MLEILRRGSGDVLYAGTDGVLLYDRLAKAHMMSAGTEQAARKLLRLLPRSCKLLTGHECFYLMDAVEYLRIGEAQICYSALYERREGVAIPPVSGEFEFRPLMKEHAAYVLEHYSHSPGGLGFIEGAIGRGMVGAFDGDVLAGFVGFHEEGSIGLLEVLPAYRKRGLGAALEAKAINLARSKGAYAFGQVIEGNTASLALQHKLGLTISKTRMFWLF